MERNLKLLLQNLLHPAWCDYVVRLFWISRTWRPAAVRLLGYLFGGRTADRQRGELDTGFGLSTRLLDKNIMTFNLQSGPLQGGCFVIPAFSRKGERWGAEHLCRRRAGRRDRWRGPSRSWLRQPALQTWTRSLTCIIARSQENTAF